MYQRVINVTGKSQKLYNYILMEKHLNYEKMDRIVHIRKLE